MQKTRALARIATDRRRTSRREEAPATVLASHRIFDRLERGIWKQLDRRRVRRRQQDVQRTLCALGER